MMTAKGWRGGLDHVFFLMTPNGVGSCFDGVSGTSARRTPSVRTTTTSWTRTASNVIYANEPYKGPLGDCTALPGFPNDEDADTTINTISHEHNESITDPYGNRLASRRRQARSATSARSASEQRPVRRPTDAYNQTINGHHYDLQQEYSNAGRRLRPEHLGWYCHAGHFGSGPLVYRGGPVMHTNTTYAIYWLPTARNTSLPVVTGTGGEQDAHDISGIVGRGPTASPINGSVAPRPGRAASTFPALRPRRTS